MSRLFDTDIDNYRELKKANFQDLDLFLWAEFCEKLGISLHSLVEDCVDYDAVFQQYYGNKNYIPKKYQAQDSSRMFTFATVIEYLQNRVDQSLATEILAHHQISTLALDNKLQGIDISLIIGSHGLVEKRGYDKQYSFEMGQYAIKKFMKTNPIKIDKNLIKNVYHLYEKFHEEDIKFLDKNWDYKIEKLDAKKCVIKSVATQRNQEKFKQKAISNQYVDAYRSGVFSSVGAFLGYPHLKVTQLKSAVDGDPYSLFEAEFPSASLALVH
ncbi:MAG: hypothetical protein ISR65_20945 [Bacteriovoracaceae bacterium]|nr:hypothetical protein [Bacteriovoracaceae bacterium]